LFEDLTEEYLLVTPSSTGGWNAEVRARLDDAIARCASYDAPLAVFDCDNTCIYNDVGDALWVWLVEHLALDLDALAETSLLDKLDEDPAGAIDLARQVLALDASTRHEHELFHAYLQRWIPVYYRALDVLGHKDGLSWVAQIMVGLPEEEVLGYCRELLEWHFDSEIGRVEIAPGVQATRGLRICESIRGLMRELEDAGVEIYIVSASCIWPVKVVADFFGLDPKKVIAIQLEVRGGELTEDVIEPVTYREGKVTAIDTFIGRTPQLVFGDAITDYEMLMRATELGVVVDRGKLDLREAVAGVEHIVTQPREELAFVQR